jgi:hypothetical protein
MMSAAACSADIEDPKAGAPKLVEFKELAILPLGAGGTTEAKIFNFKSDATGLVLRARPHGEALSANLCVVIDSVTTVEGPAWVGQYAGNGQAFAVGMQNSALLAGEAVLILPNHGIDLLATKALSVRVVVRECGSGAARTQDLPESMLLEVGWLERPLSSTPLTVAVELSSNKFDPSELISAVNTLYAPAKITFELVEAGMGHAKVVTSDCPSPKNHARIPGGLTHSAESGTVWLALNKCTNGEPSATLDTAHLARELAHQLGHFLGLYDIPDDTIDDTVESQPNLMADSGEDPSGQTVLTLSQIHVLRTHPLAH